MIFGEIELKVYANQDLFAQLVPSCCDKSGTSCYHLVIKIDDGNRLATSCYNKT